MVWVRTIITLYGNSVSVQLFLYVNFKGLFLYYSYNAVVISLELKDFKENQINVLRLNCLNVKMA